MEVLRIICPVAMVSPICLVLFSTGDLMFFDLSDEKLKVMEENFSDDF
jgi:hypothetical protein